MDMSASYSYDISVPPIILSAYSRVNLTGVHRIQQSRWYCGITELMSSQEPDSFQTNVLLLLGRKVMVLLRQRHAHNSGDMIVRKITCTFSL